MNPYRIHYITLNIFSNHFFLLLPALKPPAATSRGIEKGDKNEESIPYLHDRSDDPFWQRTKCLCIYTRLP